MSQITPTRYVLREQAIALYQEGKGYKAIASALGLSRDTIRSWIVSYRNAIGRSEYLQATGNLRKTPSYLKREERFALAREEYENCSASLLSIAKKHELNYSNLRNHILQDHPESSLLHAYAKQSDKMNAAIDDQIAAIHQIGEEYLAQMREELDNQIQRLQSP